MKPRPLEAELFHTEVHDKYNRRFSKFCKETKMFGHSLKQTPRTIIHLIPHYTIVIISIDSQLLLQPMDSLPLKMGPIGCPETSVITTFRCVITQKSAVLSYYSR
jgi:hypothetical protein